jgi:general secretion pathway protein K
MNVTGKERGAALVIVLLLVATLSFVLLSLTTIVTTGVRRGANERARTEMLWQAVAAERIAMAILEKAAAGGALQSATNEGGLFSQQLALPVERGSAALRFADASRCFNVNALIDNTGAAVPDEKARFVALLEAIGAGGNEAQAVADAVTDFLDENSTVEAQGAEDNFYTALTTPFRTAGGPIAAVSELRAVEGVTREVYARIAPFLCARERGQKIEINVNALRPEDAPLIYAITRGTWPLADIRAHIGERPPGGWQPDATPFWAPFANPSGFSLTGAAGIRSTWVEARVLLEADQRFVEETLVVETPATGKPSLYVRALGGGE